MENNTSSASGVQELINRLQQTGVEEGRTRGEQLLEEARKQAEALLRETQGKSDDLLLRAQREAERLKSAGEQAVRMAVRDAILDLKEQVVDQFSRRIQRMVTATLSDPQFLQDLVRELARRAMPSDEAGDVEVLLPAAIAEQEDLRRKPEDLQGGALNRFTESITTEMLREGLTLRTSDGDEPGIRVRLPEQDVEIDLSDKAVGGLLLRHLLPRFRVMMEGVVK